MKLLIAMVGFFLTGVLSEDVGEAWDLIFPIGYEWHEVTTILTFGFLMGSGGGWRHDADRRLGIIHSAPQHRPGAPDALQGISRWQRGRHPPFEGPPSGPWGTCPQVLFHK